MDLLEEALKVASVANRLMWIAKTGKDMMLYGSSKLESTAAWEEISRIAAENAAKPEIQGNAEHE